MSFTKQVSRFLNQYQETKNEQEIKHLLTMYKYLIENKKILEDDKYEKMKVTLMMKACDWYKEVDNVSYPIDTELKQDFKNTLKYFTLLCCTSL